MYKVNKFQPNFTWQHFCLKYCTFCIDFDKDLTVRNLVDQQMRYKNGNEICDMIRITRKKVLLPQHQISAIDFITNEVLESVPDEDENTDKTDNNDSQIREIEVFTSKAIQGTLKHELYLKIDLTCENFQEILLLIFYFLISQRYNLKFSQKQ